MAEISKKFTSDKYEVVFSVEPEEDGMRLDQYCQTFLASFSRQQIKKKIERGEVKIFKRPYPHKPSVKVYEGEHIMIFTPKGDLEDEYWNGEKLKLQLDPEILYETDDIVAISKPAYMTTHPTGKHLFNCATVYLETKYNKTVHSIHRLDRETSGVLLLGRNPKSAQVMTSLFENDEVSKCYFYMAHKNHPPHFPFVAKERMGAEDDFIPRLYVHCYEETSDQGKHAQTTFDKIFENDDYILGLAFPKTGRQHQIRTHAAHHGFPLIGDKLYNGDPAVFMRFKDGEATKEDHDKMQISRHALHSTALLINWPSKEKPTLFRAPIPQDFIEWIKVKLPEVKIEELESKVDGLIKNFFKMG
jgi:23S rRNA pseudouridine1911/1915/1917 synthase